MTENDNELFDMLTASRVPDGDDIDDATFTRLRDRVRNNLPNLVNAMLTEKDAPLADALPGEDAMFDTVIENSLATYNTLNDAQRETLRRRVRAAFTDYVAQCLQDLAAPEDGDAIASS